MVQNSTVMSITNGTNIELDWSNRVAEQIAVIIRIYSPYILLITGLPGNVLAYLIMNRRGFNHSTTSFYMRVIAVGDNIYLIFRTLQRLLIGNFRHLLPGTALFAPVCIEYHFVANTCRTFSRYVLVLMTFERFFVLAWPLKSRRLNLFRIAHIAVGVAAALAIAIGFPYLLQTYAPNYSHWVCPFFFHDSWERIYVSIR